MGRDEGRGTRATAVRGTAGGPAGRAAVRSHVLPAAQSSAVADDMLREAAAIVASAAVAGATLRLIGGVAVRWLLPTAARGATPPRDIDLVGRRRETGRIVAVMRAAGFEENRVYRLNTGGQVMQFFRPCRHRAGDGPAHADDRVDVYLDAVRLEHCLPLVERLDLTQPTVPASDVLLAKLLRTDASDHDLEDALALLRHLPLGGSARGDALDAAYVAMRCARDWGLYHDVRRNLVRCRERASASAAGHERGREASIPAPEGARGHDGRAPAEGRARGHDGRAPAAGGARGHERSAARVQGADDVGEKIAVLMRALDEHPKSLAWRLRAAFGERLPWHDMVEERDGRHLSSREHVVDCAPADRQPAAAGRAPTE